MAKKRKQNNRFAIAMIVASLALWALFISGCVPVAKVYVCSDGREVADLSMCDKKETGMTPPVQEVPNSGKSDEPEVIEHEAAIKSLGDGAKPLFEKTEAIKNIKFNYFRSDDPYTQDRYYATKDKLKVDLTLKTKFLPGETYDTVYLDYNTNTAVGYCERQAKEVCTPLNKAFNVDFEDFRIATPYSWVALAETADTTGRSKVIDGRQLKEVAFSAAGKEGTMWMDSYFGAPVEVDYDGILYRYDNMLINDAKATDFVHPVME